MRIARGRQAIPPALPECREALRQAREREALEQADLDAARARRQSASRRYSYAKRRVTIAKRTLKGARNDRRKAEGVMLRRLRLNRGWSLDELAARSGWSRSQINYCERGGSHWSDACAADLWAALGVK